MFKNRSVLTNNNYILKNRKVNNFGKYLKKKHSFFYENLKLKTICHNFFYKNSNSFYKNIKKNNIIRKKNIEYR